MQMYIRRVETQCPLYMPFYFENTFSIIIYLIREAAKKVFYCSVIKAFTPHPGLKAICLKIAGNEF